MVYCLVYCVIINSESAGELFRLVRLLYHVILLTVVPCYKRVKQMDTHSNEQEKIIEVEGDDDGGWVDTHHYGGSGTGDVSEQVAELTLDEVDRKIGKFYLLFIILHYLVSLYVKTIIP